MLPFKSTWIIRKRVGEDWLLKKYHAQMGGDMIAEVELNASRKLEAVHLAFGEKGEIYRWTDLGSDDQNRSESLRGLIRRRRVDLIEIKPFLRLGAIGQLIVGSDMFAHKFNQEGETTVRYRVLVAGKGLVNPSLRPVCKGIAWDDGKLGIRIEDKIRYIHNPDKAPYYGKTRADIIALIRRYWELNGGEVYMHVPVSDPDINGIFNRLFVDAIRIIPRGVRQCCEPFILDRHRERVQGKKVELLEAARTINRGTMGQAIGGSLLMERFYGVTVKHRTVVYGTGAKEFIEGLKSREIDLMRVDFS